MTQPCANCGKPVDIPDNRNVRLTESKDPGRKQQVVATCPHCGKVNVFEVK